MADESPVRRFLDSLNPFKRRTTPQPQMPLYTTGIQEPVLAQGITIPALYAVSHENLILRTVLSKLQQEIFRRGYFWEKKFRFKCDTCGEEYHHDVDMCNVCDSPVRPPSADEIVYPRWLLREQNSMEQDFMHVLYEIEKDLNVVDDAFLIIVKEYYVDPEDGEIQFFRVKELIRGDPYIHANSI